MYWVSFFSCSARGTCWEDVCGCDASLEFVLSCLYGGEGTAFALLSPACWSMDCKPALSPLLDTLARRLRMRVEMFDIKGTLDDFLGASEDTLASLREPPLMGGLFTRRRASRRSAGGSPARSTDWERLNARFHTEPADAWVWGSGYGMASIGKPIVVTGGPCWTSSGGAVCWRRDEKEKRRERLFSAMEQQVQA